MAHEAPESFYDDDEHILREDYLVSKSKADPVAEKEYFDLNTIIEQAKKTEHLQQLLDRVESLHERIRQNCDRLDSLRQEIVYLSEEIQSRNSLDNK